MPIPTVHQLLRPILALACEQPITRRDTTPAMEDYFKLTPEEREGRIASGSTYVRHRVGWAITFLTKGGLVEKVAPITYRATERGRAYLLEHPHEITGRDLAAIPGWKEAWTSSKDESADPPAPTVDSTPIETLDAALATLHADLKERLLSAILDQSPSFFEQLVLDVLVKMGYGGSRADAAQHVGRSGDEGIDGRINQDPLGLDQILVQAKRYAPDRTIDRQTIQAFIGSMTGQGVTKGIFITTSSFSASAREFVQRGSHTKLVLIDGDELLDRMLRHHIGLRVQRSVEVLDLDQNYFSEDE